MRISKGYWVWAQFNCSCTLRLNAIKKELKNLVKGPEFDIHLTLSGPLSGSDQSVKKNFLDLKDRLKSIEIQTNGYGFKQKYFESLFIGIKKSKKLLNLKKFVDAKFNVETEEYFPHISLFYGLEKKSSKLAFISQLPQLPKDISIDKISLVRVDEKIELWEVVQQVEVLS
ncbi:MAG: hypothetical protein VYD02_01940 [Pseudomonadota bacterium]|nr:hypothetical protein [Pseudomonadota bacterium]